MLHKAGGIDKVLFSIRILPHFIVDSQDLSEAEALRSSCKLTPGSVNDSPYGAGLIFHSDRLYGSCYRDRRSELFYAPYIGSDRLFVDQRPYAVVDQNDIIIAGRQRKVRYK